MTTLASDLAAAGMNVLLLAPDGGWRTKEQILQLAKGMDMHADGELPDTWESSMNLFDALRMFPRAAIRLSRPGTKGPIVVVATGVWMPLVARGLAALRPMVFLHLDIPGIPDREIAISRPRFWRFKIPIYRWIFSKAVGWSTVVTTINQAHARFIREEYRKDPLVIPDLLKADWLASLLALPPAASRAPPTLLYVGSLFGARLDRFLRAVSRVKTERRLDAVVIGEGPDRARYRAQYEHLGIAFPGFVTQEELLKRIGAADMCYSDVWHEIGTPYKVLEYMAAGRSVLSQDTASMRETISDHVDGVLCSPDEVSLASAVRQLVDDPELRGRLGFEARRRMQGLHTGDRLRGLDDRYGELGAPSRVTKHSASERSSFVADQDR